MTFSLSSQNVLEYLIQHNLIEEQAKNLSQVELKIAKNFNLLVTLPDNRQLLVKQERYNSEGKTAGEFVHEWRIQEFLKRFPELKYIQSWLPEVLHFDADNSIIVFNYLNNYRDLADFYIKEQIFNPVIAENLGTILATIHSATFEREDYRYFFSQDREEITEESFFKLAHSLNRVEPEIFGSVPADGIKFLALYQRYDSLEKAIANLLDTFNPCCLVHNDLKLNNILLDSDWERTLATTTTELSNQSLVRLIDWERCRWGDPAFDLGMLLASYLQLWLSSLVVSKTISLEESLSLAMIPLEQLQPSLASLATAYLQKFPQILAHFPTFLHRVIQFSGLALIYQIQANIQYQKTFGNAGICTLQVAKSLLCRPEQSLVTVFGCSESELYSLLIVNCS
jgi:serine/threonine protein kinase